MASLEDVDDAQQEHGLTVQLHPYQRQSPQWMLDEEAHEVGCYRR